MLLISFSGWIKTFEAYYHDQTKNILDAMLTYLLMFKDMRFVYAEISFFEQWWAGLDEEARENVKKFVTVIVFLLHMGKD